MPSGITLKKTDPADIETPATDKATIFLDDGTGEPSYKDDAAAVHTLVGTAGADGADGVLTYLDHGNTGSTETVTVSAGDVQRLVANAATVMLTLAGWPSAGTPGICRLLLTQDATGGRDWVFPVAVDFGTAGEPDWTASGPGDVDIVDLTSVDGGSTVIASVAGRAGATGAAGTNGTNGTNGTTGGAVTIPYTFSTTTTDSDPGSGNLRLSNATQTSATVIRADLLASDGTDWTAVLNTLADASNTVKGHVRLFKTSDPTKWLLFTVSAVATPSGYRNITVANVSGSASSPFSNGDAITLTFTRAGDQGSTVGSGTLTTIEEVDGSPTDSAVTKLVMPNGSLAIASHVATYTPTEVAGRLLAVHQYAPASQTILTAANSATLADVDATNMVITFTAPASGNILVRLGAVSSSTSDDMVWGLREGSTIVARGRGMPRGGTNVELFITATFYITGIAAGSHTYKWAFSNAVAGGGTQRILVQDGASALAWAPALMEVWAA